MIIELHDDIDSLLYQTTDPLSKTAQGINKIFQLMLERKHIVFASRKLLSAVNSYNFINPANKSIIAQILIHYVEFYSSLPNTNKKLVVVPSETYFSTIDNNEYITLDKCVNLSQAILSTENPRDYIFYCNLFKFMNTNELATINFANNSFAGGSAKDILKSMAINNNILLAICDSDKDYETSELGSTACSVYRFFKNHKDAEAYMDFYILPVREKENLIPLECYELFSEDLKKPLINTIKCFSGNQEFMKYVDLKEGYKLKNINTNSSEWHKLYDCYVEECKKNNIFNTNATHSDDHCISGIGGKLADDLSDYFFNGDSNNKLSKKKKKEAANFDINQHIPSYIMNIYQELFSLMITYGCVFKKVHNSFLYR